MASPKCQKCNDAKTRHCPIHGDFCETHWNKHLQSSRECREGVEAAQQLLGSGSGGGAGKAAAAVLIGLALLAALGLV